ncbi:hypothetical protein ACWJJH_18380 [Endozoicomonadaceae bacterium StTr2]
MGFRPEIHISASQLRRERAASVSRLTQRNYPVFVRNLRGKPVCEMLSAEQMDYLEIACFDCSEALELLEKPKDISFERLRGYAHYFFSEKQPLTGRFLYRVLDIDNDSLFFIIPADLKDELERLLGHVELTSVNTHDQSQPDFHSNRY